MARKKTPKQTATLEHFSEYILNTEEACIDAAYKLNIVIAMIRNTQDPESRKKNDDDGGYGLTAARNLPYEIRDELRKAASASEAARKTPAAAGAR